MPGRKLLLFLLASLFAFLIAWTPGAAAQRRFEITPFFGSRFGGRIQVDTSAVDYLKIKSGMNYGVLGDVNLWRHFYVEFMFNRQPTTFTAHDIGTGDFVVVSPTAKVDMYQWSGLYQFRQYGARLRPFIVAGMGFTHYDSDGRLNFHNRLSFNVGGGLKYFFTDHLGARLEARYSPSETTFRNGLYCDPFFLVCYPTPVPNYAQQGQANAGFIVRF